MWIKSAICLALVGLTICAADYAIGRREERKHWVKLKGFSGAVRPGDIKSMKPVMLSVWRFRSDKRPETTHERLEFAIPAAYMIDRSNLAGGRQQAIYLYVHWPTGEPDGLHKNIEQYNRHSAGWPQEKYYVELTSWGTPVVSRPEQARTELLKSLLYTKGSFGSEPNPYRGKYCGWESFDEIHTGMNTLEVKNQKSGITSELYFDTLDPKKWRRRIKCGPNMRVCTLYTDYQRFALAINFSPLNICKARDFEVQTKAMLDRFLIKHHPPTRMWSKKQDPAILVPYENSNEWTQQNLNNANIRQAAR